jgi:hypothetical protein
MTIGSLSRPNITLMDRRKDISLGGRTVRHILIRCGLEVSLFSFLFYSQGFHKVTNSKHFLGMGFSSDFMPYVGEVPNNPGQFIPAGYSGHGMLLIGLVSKGIAAMLRGEKAFEQTGVPKLLKPTVDRLESTKTDVLDNLATPSPASEI